MPYPSWLRALACVLKRTSRSQNGRPTATIRPTALAVETLETRVVLDAGAAWGSAAHLTLSFAPDQTDVSGHASQLFSTLDNVDDTARWQAAVLRAFQTWGQATNVNIGLVADGGQPFGSGGPSQGDPRFGDVRIGAIPMSPEVLAVSVPYDDSMSGSWAGDLLFNSQADFQAADDIFSVALHEAGHVLGLPHSDDPQSPMHAHHPTQAVLPTVDDMAMLRALYGARSLDRNEGNHGNDSFRKATRLKASGGLHGSAPLIVYGDVQDAQDVDYFFLPPLSGYSGALTFQLRSAGISLLSPRMSLYDEGGQLMQSAQSSTALGDVLSLRIDEVADGETYYVRIEGATDDLFGVGSYALVASYDNASTVDQAKIDAVALGGFEFLRQDELQQLLLSSQTPNFNDDAHENDTFSDATALKITAGFDESAHYQTVGSIADSTDIDFYNFRSAEVAEDEENVATISVRTLSRNALTPKVTVFDRSENKLPADILVNGNGDYVVQVSGLESRKTYFVKVEASNPDGAFATGNYDLSISFGNQRAPRDTFASGFFEGTDSRRGHTLHIAQTQLFHFALAASGTQQDPATLIWTTIYAADGSVVYRVATRPGETRTAKSVILTPGSYYVQLDMVSRFDEPLPLTSYQILGAALSDPIGPEIIDPSETPIFTCPEGGDQFCYPGDVISETPFIWVEGDIIPFPDVTLTDLPWVDIDWWYWYEDWLATNVPP